MKNILKNRNNPLFFTAIIFFTVIQVSCKRDPIDNPTYGQKTLELISIVDNNPNIKSMLLKSIDLARVVNPDKNTNPAQTLDEYYEFVTWAETCMPWSILPKTPYTSLYDKIDQSLDYFYFINDQPLTELEGLGLYNNSLQYVAPYKDWLVSFNKAWGLYLDKPESWKDEYYQLALTDNKFGLKAGWYEDPSNVQDYHRYHFPVGGVVKEIRNIAEQDAAGGITTWNPTVQRYMLDPITVAGWQSIETRGCVIIDMEVYGLVAILPIGMSQICSAKFENNIHAGTRVKKGDMLGCFLFGGSDIVMVFQSKAGFALEPANGGSGQSYQHILMGEKYGVLTGLN